MKDCKGCGISKEDDCFSVDRTRGTVIYLKSKCRECMRKSRVVPKAGFAGRLDDDEKKRVLDLAPQYGKISLAQFYRECNLKMKLESFRRWDKLGKVREFLPVKPEI